MNTLTNLAYHFVGATLRDGSPVPPDGVWLRSPVQPVLCASGLHASREPFDAFPYAPGDTLCLVEVRDIVTEYTRKLVAWERKIVKRIDATELLQYFARTRAITALQHWAHEPPQVVFDWLMTGDESLREAARRAARSATWAETRSMPFAWTTLASAAAHAAAWSVAWSAARSVAESAAWSAATAARSAAEAMRCAWRANDYAVRIPIRPDRFVSLALRLESGWLDQLQRHFESGERAARDEFNLIVGEAFE